MVIKNKRKQQENSSSMVYKTPSKFLAKRRHEFSQYTSANSSVVGQELIYSKYSKQDIQKEFLRLYTQLELLKKRNMRVGNRHLDLKINAMQDAARMCDNDNEKSSIIIQSSSNLCISAERSEADIQDYKHNVSNEIADNANEKTLTVIEKQPAVSHGKEDNAKQTKEKKNVDMEQSSSTYPTGDTRKTSMIDDTNGRHLISGHARTHSIVINLDDKSLLTDEITV